MLPERYKELKNSLGFEMRAKLRREYLNFLDEYDEVKDEVHREIMNDFETELLQIEGRDYEGDDVYREEFIRMVQRREVMVKIINEPIDWVELEQEIDPSFGK